MTLTWFGRLRTHVTTSYSHVGGRRLLRETVETMRICVTGLRGIPGVMGGVETHCEELLPRVAALAPGMEIIALARDNYVFGEASSYRGIVVVPLPSVRSQSIEAIVSTLVGICYARWRGARLIHIHAIGPGLLSPLARLVGLRVVVTHHGSDYDRAKWGPFAKLMLRLGERASLRAAHRLIAVSPSLAEMLAQRYPAAKDKIRYVPNGAPALGEATETRTELLARFGLDEDRFVLAVGRLVPEKGFDYLIEAFRRSGTDRKLVIVGAADHQSEFSRSLLAQADEQILFLGLQPRSMLRHLYQATSLFVLPSFHEGLPISALEAACCDAPMLLSNISANRDIGLPPANYFPTGDLAALADALTRPSTDFAIDSAAIRERFDWDRIARHTLAIYREAT